MPDVDHQIKSQDTGTTLAEAFLDRLEEREWLFDLSKRIPSYDRELYKLQQISIILHGDVHT